MADQIRILSHAGVELAKGTTSQFRRGQVKVHTSGTATHVQFNDGPLCPLDTVTIMSGESMELAKSPRIRLVE